MRRTSVKRHLENNFNVVFAAGIVTGVFVACSGGGEFTSKPPEKDPDASVESGAGGGNGAGGAGGGAVSTNGGSTNGGSTNGGSANGGSGGPIDAGSDASEGGLPPPACVRNEDCAPFMCNGTPTCVEGVCAPSDPCESPEGGACINVCVRTATAASCIVMGRDEDRDGHRDARCDENPGDDCDDTQPAVHAEAKEICDGVDNDCDGLTDSFDGVSFGGTTSLVKHVAKSAQLGFVTRPNGFALLSNEMPDMYGGSGIPSEIRMLDPDGGVRRTVDVHPAVRMNDSAIAAAEDSLVVAGWNAALPAHYLAIARLMDNGTWQPTMGVATDDATTNVLGRAIATTPDGAVTTVIVATYVSTSFGGVEDVSFNVLNQPGLLDYAVQLGNTPWRAYRPHMVPRRADRHLATFVATQPLAGSSTELTAAVRHMEVQIEGLPSSGSIIDTFTIPKTEGYLQGESVRPQVVVDGEDHVVAYLRTAGELGFIAFDQNHQKKCQVGTIDGIASWGSNSSLVRTPLGVLLAATSVDGDAVLYRLAHGALSKDKPCPFERIGVLTPPGSRIALSERFEKRELLCSLGDPAMALGNDGRLAVAWVERDETGGEAGDGGVVNDPPVAPRIVLRMLGDKLCN